MRRIILLILALLMCTALQASAAGRRPADAWSFYHFDGSAFVPGPSADGTAYIALRENVRPVIVTGSPAHIEQNALPDGSGVIAGICYIQSTGGKLAGGSSFQPYQRVPLLISSGGRQLVTVQTDDFGYFVVTLAAGTYAVGSGPFTAEITVERGVTSLVPLRAGKRMAD